MPQVYVSQNKIDFRPGDDAMPSVRASASVEASRIVADILTPGMRIEGDAIMLSWWALHRMALAIERIAARGLDADDGMPPHGQSKEPTP